MSVADAYISILPDFGDFGRALLSGVQKAAGKAAPTIEVKPDTGKFDKALAGLKPKPVTVEAKAGTVDFSTVDAGASSAGRTAGNKFAAGFDETASNDISTRGEKVEGAFDGLATRASIAAGGIGDLAGALGDYGIISESTVQTATLVASGIQGIAGVSDLAVIATQLLRSVQAKDIVQKTILIGQNIALRVGALASAAAMTVQAVAQRGLNAAMRANPIGAVITVLTLLVGGLILAYQKSETFRNIVNGAWKGIQTVIGYAWNNVIKPAFTAIVGFVQTKLIPIITFLWVNVIKPYFKLIGTVISTVWNSVVKPVFSAISGFITRDLIPKFEAFQSAIKTVWAAVKTTITNVWTDKIRPILAKLRDFPLTIQTAFETMKTKVGDFLDGLRGAAAKPINFIIGTVYNNGLRKALNLIPGVNLAEASKITDAKGNAYARGGIMPGYSPGKDIHRFYSPTGGRLDLSGGEAVLRPEATRFLGAAGVNTINQAARQQGTKGVAKAMAGLAHSQHFDGGGTVSWHGGTFTPKFQGRLAQVFKTHPFSVFQGGFRPATSYSGTSHAKDAVDVGPVSGSLVKALRGVGIAAWDRTGMGNWAPHIHGVPLPGAGTAGGSGVWQAQDYLRGGNGLGGRDNGAGSGGANPNNAGKGGGIVDAIFKLPGIVKGLIESIKNMTSGGWWDLAKSAAKGAANIGIDYINSKTPGSLDLPRFATGGLMAQTGLARVGERGPETVALRGGARVFANGDSVPVYVTNINEFDGRTAAIANTSYEESAAFERMLTGMRG